MLLAKYFSDLEIEKPQSVGVQESLAGTRYAVARFSTVLLQAHNAGVATIIDDYTDPLRYNLLLDEDYIMLQKTNLRLSEILKWP